MILKRITICNFRNFKGEQVIDIAPDNEKKRNVILIGGANGSGKTSILDAMRLCIFGKRFNGYAEFKNNYQKYLLSSKNRSSTKQGDSRFYIQIDMEINDSLPPYPLTIKREWKIDDKNIVKEDFIILRDGAPLELIPKEYWEEHIISLVPPQISDYFFFDGERVKELAVGSNAEEILRESIRDLIGLNIYETLDNDLEDLTDKIRRRNIIDNRLLEEIKARDNEISMLNHKIDHVKREISNNIDSIAKLSSEREKIEEDLKRTAGAYALARKKNEDEIFKLKETLNTTENEIRDLCGNVLPFIMASNVCYSLVNQLEKERRLKEFIASKGILTEVNQELIRRMKNDRKLAEIPREQMAVIEKEINSIFSQMLRVDKTANMPLLHDLTSTEMDEIESFINSAERDLKPKLSDLLQMRGKTVLSMKRINDKLKKVPDETYIKEYIEKISSIRSQMELKDQENVRLYDERQLLDEKVRMLREEIREREEKVVCLEEDNRKIEISKRIRNTIKEFTNVMVSSRIKELEKIITEMYRKLANKDDMVKEIKIDKKTFITRLLDYEGDIVNKEHISAGEKEIYALSVLWGLSKISNKQLPIIIDSPLAKLDNSHVGNIITNFFPNAGEQVVILSHDREIDHNSYLKLRPRISMAYTLSFDEENKIVKSYFSEV